MKIYSINGAPNGRKVEATLRYLDTPIERVWLNIKEGEHKRPDYLAINPNGLIPTLVEDDFILWESHAIMIYLVEKAGGSELYPKDLRRRAEVDRWLNWCQSRLQPALFVIMSERFLKPMIRGEAGDESLAAAAIEKFHDVAPILEKQLAATGAFVTGPQVTLADFALAAISGFWKLIHLPLEGFPAITAWVARLDEIPAWRDTAPPLERLQPA